jgi:phenylacetate-CoA ligase
MTEHFDTLETRDPEVRERALLARLPIQIAYAKAHAPAFARMLDGVNPLDVTSREALARLPVTRKSDLAAMQAEARPFGGLAATRRGADGTRAARVFASPGPIYEPEGRSPDYYRIARAMFAAGFRAGDLVHNSFAYHLTPARSSRPELTRSGARCFREAPARPNCRCARWSISRPTLTRARRRSSRSCSRRPTSRASR